MGSIFRISKDRSFGLKKSGMTRFFIQTPLKARKTPLNDANKLITLDLKKSEKVTKQNSLFDFAYFKSVALIGADAFRPPAFPTLFVR
jgi:hypothetical protein